MLFSDFRGLDATGRAHLAYMARHNALFMFFVHDPIEQQLPPPGRYHMVSGQQTWVLDTANSITADIHRKRYLEHLSGLQELCRRNTCSFIPCSTDEDPQAIMQRALGGAIRS
jgi:hypothetical protein